MMRLTIALLAASAAALPPHNRAHQRDGDSQYALEPLAGRGAHNFERRDDIASVIDYDAYIEALALGNDVVTRRHLLLGSDKFALAALGQEPCGVARGVAEDCVGGAGIKSVVGKGWVPNFPTYFPTYDVGAPLGSDKAAHTREAMTHLLALRPFAVGDHTSTLPLPGQLGGGPGHVLPNDCKFSVSVVTANMELNPAPGVGGLAHLIRRPGVGIASVCEQETTRGGFPKPTHGKYKSLAEAVAGSHIGLAFVPNSVNSVDGTIKGKKVATRSGLVANGVQAAVVHRSSVNVATFGVGAKAMVHTTVDVTKGTCPPKRLIFACVHMPTKPTQAHFDVQHDKIMSKVARSVNTDGKTWTGSKHTGGSRAVAAAFWSGDFNSRPDEKKVSEAIVKMNWRPAARPLTPRQGTRLARLKELYEDGQHSSGYLAISKHRKSGKALANGWLDRVLYCASPDPESKTCDNDGKYQVKITADINLPVANLALAGSDHLPIMVQYEVRDTAEDEEDEDDEEEDEEDEDEEDEAEGEEDEEDEPVQTRTRSNAVVFR